MLAPDVDEAFVADRWDANERAILDNLEAIRRYEADLRLPLSEETKAQGRHLLALARHALAEHLEIRAKLSLIEQALQ